jgi:hypothetical protein
MRYFRSERLLKEFDNLRRTAHGEIRRDSMIAVGDGFCCHDWPPSLLWERAQRHQELGFLFAVAVKM